MKNQTKRIFLDYASVTPVDLEVAKEIERVKKMFWANPSSLHLEGENAKNILEEARVKIARLLHCRKSEVFFTGSGTESLNLAILGVIKGEVERLKDLKIERLPHIITSTIEHPAVLEPIKNLLKEKKVEISYIAPNEKGLINPESIRKEIKDNTVLVVVQHANNEIGVIQPIRKIKEVIENYKTRPESIEGLKIENSSRSYPFLLVDSCQSVLYEDVSLEKLGADLLVLDGIKMYGPRGIGVLVVKDGTPISSIIFGGGQEKGLRSGTENVPAISGLAKALEIASKMRKKESERLTKLRDYGIASILKNFSGSSLNGSLEDRLPNNINICLATPKPLAKVGLSKLDSEFLVIKLDTLGFAVSAASACHTLSLENGSYVIESLSKSECASSSLRITLGRDTKKSDLDSLISALKKIIK